MLTIQIMTRNPENMTSKILIFFIFSEILIFAGNAVQNKRQNLTKVHRRLKSVPFFIVLCKFLLETDSTMRKIFLILAVSLLYFSAIAFSGEPVSRPDILIADFETATYGDWKVEGEAFGPGPVEGAYPGQNKVGGFEGDRLANSYFKGDRTIGKLISPEFTIERKYINFLIGGGGFKDETCMRLLVDGKEVRQSTGSNLETLLQAHWDVTPFEGKKALIEIVDDRTEYWGHVNVDQIVQSDEKRVQPRPSFLSKVPSYVFPETLPEQWDALKNNPLLKRFHESRKNLATDKFRPRYHYVNPESSLNDPNGLCFWQGRWHLFYQAYPPEDSRQHWGHTVSDDLIHWKDLPLALYPDPEEMCFSGACLAENDRVIAIYHGIQAGTMLAISTDPLLLNWKKQTDFAVIPMYPPGGPGWTFSIYDPCLWKEGEYYYALQGVGKRVGIENRLMPAWPLFRSKDLISWEFVHSFVEDDHYSLVGDDGACPYFWPIGDQSDPEKRRHILLHFSHYSGGKYLIGKYDTEKQKFFVTRGGDFNHGPVGPGGVHAPSAYPDGRGGVNVIFNMNPALPTQGWDHLMSLPLNLNLLQDDRLSIEPVKAVETLRGEHRRIERTELPTNREIVLEKISGKSLEMQFVIEPKGSKTIEIDVFRSPDRNEYTRIVYYPFCGYTNRFDPSVNAKNLSTIAIDSTYSALEGAQSRIPEVADVPIAENEPVEIRIFLDQSVVEVFVNGRQMVAQRVYPTRDDSVGVSIQSRGGGAVMRSLDAWPMNSIYEP